MTETKQDEATPRPWSLAQPQQIYGVNGKGIVWVSGEETTHAEDCANAELIYIAVNRDHLLDEAVEALRAISMIAGNLPDETLETCGGINEGRGRALMALQARQIARAVLAKIDAAEKEVSNRGR